MAAAWDAFISYARAESGRTAIEVQRGLERFARPWNQRRAVRVFRDDSALSANPALWSAIEEGLAAASTLIVLLSPGAGDSAYVDKEVRWWLDHKGPRSILLVLDAGELEWEQSGNRFSDDSPVPPSLRDAFDEEPRWLDLRWLRDSPSPATDARFAAAMADLSAPIRGVPRDDLIGEDLVQHRRVRRLTRSAVTLLAVLLAVSLVSTVVAVQQRDDVLRQAVTLRARGLANTASGLLDTDLRLAQLLAVQGYRTEPSAATRNALLQAAFASPLVERFLTFDADVTALAAATKSPTVLVGLADGRVFGVDPDGRTPPVLRFTAPAAVTTLRASADGGVLLVGTRDAVIVVGESGSRTLAGGQDAPLGDAMALSPSGRRAALASGQMSAHIVVYDTTTGAETLRRTDPLAPPPNTPVVAPQYTDHLTFVGEHRLRLVGVDVRWSDLDLRTGRVGPEGWVDWAPYANLYSTSHRGDYLLAAPITDGRAVRAWRLDRPGGNRAPLTASVPLTDPLGMAVSPDGRLVLVNDSASGLSVAPVDDPDAPPVVPATRVPGIRGVTAMEFTGPTTAVVAGRSRVAFLRFGGLGRGATGASLFVRGLGGVPEYAVDYRNSGLAVSPDGTRVATLELNYAELEVVALPGSRGRAVPKTALRGTDTGGALAGPVWLDDDTVLVLSSGPGEAPSQQVAPGVVQWNLGLPAAGTEGDLEIPLAAAPTGSGTVLVATGSGAVQTREATGGRLVGAVAAGAPGTEYDLGRFSADGAHLALIRTGYDSDPRTADVATLRVVDTASGTVLHEQQWPDEPGLAGVAFSGTTLLVSHVDGAVDVLPDLGRGAATRIATGGIRSSSGSSQRNPPVVGIAGLVGFPTRSGLELYDLSTLQPAGAVPVPPGFEAVPRTYAVAPDGHTLVTGFFGADARTARVGVRDLGTDAVIAQACAAADGPITTPEWRLVMAEDPPAELACR